MAQTAWQQSERDALERRWGEFHAQVRPVYTEPDQLFGYLVSIKQPIAAGPHTSLMRVVVLERFEDRCSALSFCERWLAEHVNLPSPRPASSPPAPAARQRHSIRQAQPPHQPPDRWRRRRRQVAHARERAVGS